MLSLLVTVPVFAGWRWHYLKQRARLKRFEEALEQVSGSGTSSEALALLSGDASLEVLRNRLERLVGVRDSMLQRIEHEEFSLRTVLSSMEEGVLVADDSQIIRLVNPAFSKIFAQGGACVGRSVLEVLGEPEIFRLLKLAMESGGGQQKQVEMVPGRSVKHVTVHAVPMSDVKGRPGVLAVFRDVTRLQELEKVRREFVANVSHELRTPLAIFQGYVENLLEMPDLPEADRQDILGILRKHSLRLNALVEDLLALARLEAGREEFRWEVMDMGRCVSSLVRDWGIRGRERGVELRVECDSDLSPVRADPLRIEQVLHNLLENALKHVPQKGGSVSVHVQREDAGVLVCVEDNGSGIAPMDLPHIFERFYRANKSRTAGVDGHSTGLGLSIVKHIVAHHGGEVGASASPSKGARVWFRLPAAALSES
ncbi:MAG: ATP-binding protein [Verrucomicrobiota bacterium]